MVERWTEVCFILCQFSDTARIISGAMVWGEAFMPSPWSNAFDSLHQHPPGSRNLKEGRSRRRVKRHQKSRRTPMKFIFAVRVCWCVRVQSHPDAVIIRRVLQLCFQASQSEWWAVKSGLCALQPPSLAPADFSLLFHVTVCLSTATSAPPFL